MTNCKARFLFPKRTLIRYKILILYIIGVVYKYIIVYGNNHLPCFSLPQAAKGRRREDARNYAEDVKRSQVKIRQKRLRTVASFLDVHALSNLAKNFKIARMQMVLASGRRRIVQVAYW